MEGDVDHARCSVY